ncbi:hypothetical protein GYW75_09100 [Gilliamella sp. ESL0232]|uniref:hypothetical protein n=1 Tax=Gilliamella sp. ESL0232 TaxID=2705037 RepID=UPI001580C990|nr:hypothetical protein [Gilliamella sp. ESL0232]NUE96531.1 hypothetical protein [Gilliamella sp. ESL0232]
MKLLNYKSIILATTLSLTGCIYGDLDKRSRMDIYRSVVEYCESNHYSFCEVYAQCYLDILNQLYVNQGFMIATMWSVLEFSPVNYSAMNAKDTMDALYSELKEKEKINRKDISLDVSYLLYSHNQCSSIIGAKQYDISHYHHKIEESIERKKENE